MRVVKWVVGWGVCSKALSTTVVREKESALEPYTSFGLTLKKYLHQKLLAISLLSFATKVTEI